MALKIWDGKQSYLYHQVFHGTRKTGSVERKPSQSGETMCNAAETTMLTFVIADTTLCLEYKLV